MKDCTGCEHFVTAFNLNGTVYFPQACTNRDCFISKKEEQQAKRDKKAEKNQTKVDSTDGNNDEDDGPRVAWHGKLFREHFYRTALPAAIAAADPAADNSLHLAAFALMKAHDVNDTFSAFMAEKGIEVKKKGAYNIHFEDGDAFAAIKGLIPADTLELIKRLSTSVVMSWENLEHRDGFKTSTRDAVAPHFGIDIAKDFVLTEQYLNAKTKAEVLAIIDAMPDEKRSTVQNWMLKRNPQDRLETKKKADLIKLIIDSKVDLKGIVPDEVLNYDSEIGVPKKNIEKVFGIGEFAAKESIE